MLVWISAGFSTREKFSLKLTAVLLRNGFCWKTWKVGSGSAINPSRSTTLVLNKIWTCLWKPAKINISHDTIPSSPDAACQRWGWRRGRPCGRKRSGQPAGPCWQSTSPPLHTLHQQGSEKKTSGHQKNKSKIWTRALFSEENCTGTTVHHRTVHYLNFDQLKVGTISKYTLANTKWIQVIASHPFVLAI